MILHTGIKFAVSLPRARCRWGGGGVEGRRGGRRAHCQRVRTTSLLFTLLPRPKVMDVPSGEQTQWTCPLGVSPLRPQESSQ